MFHVLVLTDREGDLGPLTRAIGSEGVGYSARPSAELLVNGHRDPVPDAVLLDIGSLSPSRARELISQCREQGLPVLTMVPAGTLTHYDSSLDPDDMVVQPIHAGELEVRLKQAILKVKGTPDQRLIQVAELVINLERYEVTVAGQRVLLTYKEYQLLVLLASNPGKVYTRENLLSRLWGYDYFGGTRTVDVHIRRLRAKVEDGGRSFIETIRNVGYRFEAPQ